MTNKELRELYDLLLDAICYMNANSKGMKARAYKNVEDAWHMVGIHSGNIKIERKK
tara:strand:- start:536 stop:703 length:168 start_codon:yes stop_codon:yes gene_type:complete